MKTVQKLHAKFLATPKAAPPLKTPRLFFLAAFGAELGLYLTTYARIRVKTHRANEYAAPIPEI